MKKDIKLVDKVEFEKLDNKGKYLHVMDVVHRYFKSGISSSVSRMYAMECLIKNISVMDNRSLDALYKRLSDSIVNKLKRLLEGKVTILTDGELIVLNRKMNFIDSGILVDGSMCVISETSDSFLLNSVKDKYKTMGIETITEKHFIMCVLNEYENLRDIFEEGKAIVDLNRLINNISIEKELKSVDDIANYLLMSVESIKNIMNYQWENLTISDVLLLSRNLSYSFKNKKYYV